FGYHPDLESRLTFQEKWVLAHVIQASEDHLNGREEHFKHLAAISDRTLGSGAADASGHFGAD
ncbi:hypothetical protein, partial [Bradyrhizobium diazoefficiens]|uniref:hypothetical protein n=1 Tax=Bradyrhizobium diazoefficiens TaxID=1355477 RepID=UPI001FE1E934